MSTGATASGAWLLLASGVLIGATLPGMVRVHTAEAFLQPTSAATRNATALVGTGREGAALRAMQAMLRGDAVTLDGIASLVLEPAPPAGLVGKPVQLEPTGVAEAPPIAMPAASPEQPEMKAAEASSFARPAPRPAPPAAKVHATIDTRELPVRRVLQAYERAWTRMDTDAARAIWPSADATVLQAAFRPVSEQRLKLAACDVGMSGDRALAICFGTLRYRPRDGRSGPHVERGRWEFELQRSPQGWQISTVERP